VAAESAMNVLPGDESCFGCGAENPQGLHLQFTRPERNVVECVVMPAPHLCGSRTVVHGGIQATIIDETMGKAARLAGPEGELWQAVTASLAMRYRRPAAMEQKLTVRATVDRVEGDDVYIAAAIIGEDGTLLTTADGRFKVIKRVPVGEAATGDIK
jgi:acyl-coenzyme A thioesterase PaaI-like protein